VKSTLLAAGVLLTLPTDSELATRYASGTALRIESRLELEMETTAMSMLRDGEPVEGRGFGGGGSSTTLKGVVVDRYVEAAAGAPTRVRRLWTELEGEAVMSMGGEDRSLALESDFTGVEVELSREESGELSAEVVEGSGPDVDVLARLRPELALDAFLPGTPVAEGAEWNLDSAAVLHGLGLDVTLFRRPQREGEGGGPGGGPGGGRRGGFGGRGGSVEGQLAAAEWSGRATFAALEDFEGVSCARIALSLEGESESDEEGTSASFQARLQGSLWFDLTAKRPAGLDLEGTLESEMDMTREREGSVTEIHRESEGTFSQRVRVTSAPFERE
jgi:hypothetical protein